MELNSVLVEELPADMLMLAFREPKTTGIGCIKRKRCYTIIDNIARLGLDIELMIQKIIETDVHELIHIAGEILFYHECKAIYMGYLVTNMFFPGYAEECFRMLHRNNYVGVNRSLLNMKKMRSVVLNV